LQLMALQIEGSRIRVLPAWPKDWNISFKLHAPQGTTVECIYRNGKIEKLVVDPSERLRDVVCPAPLDVQV
jgi:alpha-L-fucosidase 2